MLFDGFDYLGNPTGKKCMICSHQNERCEHQEFFGEGAFLICTNPECLDLEKCIKDKRQ